jgi:hypothetical protein
MIATVLVTLANCSQNSRVSDSPYVEEESAHLSSDSISSDKTVSSMLLIERTAENWIVDLSKEQEMQIEAGFVAFSWSNTGIHLLLYNTIEESRGLYIANEDGSSPIFITNEYGSPVESKWLANNTVLLQFSSDFGQEQSISILNIDDKQIEEIEYGKQRVLEAVSPNGKFWVQSDYHTGAFELVTVDGLVFKILEEFLGFQKSSQPSIDPNVVFTALGDAILFDACEMDEKSDEQACHIYKAHISGNSIRDISRVYDLGEFRNISFLQTSPNGVYLSFIDYSTNELIFLNMETYSVDHRREWGNSNYYLWEPNSKYVVYESFDKESIQPYQGLAIMDIETGEEYLITDGESAERVLDWRLIPLE